MHLFIPTPSNSKLELGFLTLHYYALSILVGILVAVYLTRKRYVARGGVSSEISDLALYLIPTGIIGGRIYHVVTSPDAYWQGGMGMWGAVFFGALAAFIYFKVRKRVGTFKTFADSVVPGLLLAQGIGRFGNWFNGELFGRPTKLPWGLEIPVNKRPLGFGSFLTFHPTFLYEALWCFLCAAIILKSKWLNSRNSGQLFLAYIALYSFGRLWIETLRIDAAHLIFGIRLNVWVSLFTLTLSSAYFLRTNLKLRRQKSDRAY
jgi:prolipoprotein diacylglyceryl transferase